MRVGLESGKDEVGGSVRLKEKPRVLGILVSSELAGAWQYSLRWLLNVDFLENLPESSSLAIMCRCF